jgi:hypothetical protein
LLTRRGLVGQADLAVRGLVVRDPVALDPVALDPVVRDLVVLGPVGPVDLGLAGRVDLDLAARGPVDRAALAHIRDPVGLVGLGRADPVVLEPAGRVGLVDQGMDLVGLAVLGRVDLVGPGLVDQGMDPADRVARAVLDLAVRAHLVDRDINRVDLAGRVGLAGQVDRADRHRRLTRPEVLSTAVARRWAARGMCRTASAHPVTVHRRRPHNTDGAGTVGLHPERRRLSGTDRRPRVAGTVHRLPVVGTPHGTGRRAT